MGKETEVEAEPLEGHPNSFFAVYSRAAHPPKEEFPQLFDSAVVVKREDCCRTWRAPKNNFPNLRSLTVPIQQILLSQNGPPFWETANKSGLSALASLPTTHTNTHADELTKAGLRYLSSGAGKEGPKAGSKHRARASG